MLVEKIKTLGILCGSHSAPYSRIANSLNLDMLKLQLFFHNVCTPIKSDEKSCSYTNDRNTLYCYIPHVLVLRVI